MKVEIWSDVVCPWCYIGKRRFEKALARFAHRAQVEIVWRSFELDPTAPQVSTETVNEILARKYNMSQQQVAATTANVTALAAKEGLEYHLDNAKRSNTFDAHRLIHLAAAHGLQPAAKERLLQAYFTEGLTLGDSETLVQLGTEIGLPADEVREALAGDAYAEAVRADEQRAAMLGISGVPFFVIDEKYGVSGAQETALLLKVLEQVWSETRPLTLLNTEADETANCDDGSCAVEPASPAARDKATL